MGQFAFHSGGGFKGLVEADGCGVSDETLPRKGRAAESKDPAVTLPLGMGLGAGFSQRLL